RAAAQRLRGRLPGQDDRRPDAGRRLAPVRLRLRRRAASALRRGSAARAEGGLVANDKTEKATPKKKDDARKKGQVAKSADVNGSFVLIAGLIAMSAFGPKVM